MDYIKQAIQAAAEAAQKHTPSNAIVGRDGLLHCPVCAKPLQVQLSIAGATYTVPCLCACGEAKQAAAEESERAERQRIRAEHYAKTCYGWRAAPAMMQKTFAHSCHNPRQTALCRDYAANFDRMRAEGRGLLMYGGVGTGKSYLAACIANELLLRPETVRMTSIATLATMPIDQRDDAVEYGSFCHLLILDDLGAERRTPYVMDLLFTLIDSRLSAGLPTIVTTNLSPAELAMTDDLAFRRLTDRLFETMTPVKFEGDSLRKKAFIARVKGEDANGTL